MLGYVWDIVALPVLGTFLGTERGLLVSYENLLATTWKAIHGTYIILSIHSLYRDESQNNDQNCGDILSKHAGGSHVIE